MTENSVADNPQNAIAVVACSSKATTPNPRGEENRGEEEIWWRREQGREGCGLTGKG